MSIANKVLLFMILMVSVFLAADFIIQKEVIYPAFSRIEHENAKVNIDRVENALNAAIDQLDRNTYDWSSWDDTYQFLKDKNDAYIESNLQPETFQNLQTNLVYFLDPNLKPVWAAKYDFTDESVTVVTSDAYVAQSIALLKADIQGIDTTLDSDKQFARGIFIQDGLPVLFSVRTVLNSAGKGPPHGYMVQGRILNDALLAKFRENTRIDFDLTPIDQIPGQATAPGTYRITPLSDSVLDIAKSYYANGLPVLQISTHIPRDITLNGMNSIRYALTAFFVIGLVSILLIWALLKFSIFVPIRRLTNQIMRISDSKNYGLRSDIDSKDEVGVLAKAFNNMLAIIERNKNELETTYAQIKRDHDRIAYTESELRVANTELERLAGTDSLTGIANRLAFEQTLELEWRSLRRSGEPLSILMIDIDHFKHFNDHYGHQTGDQCLKTVARHLQACMRRPGDLVARYGGEEFIAVLPRTDVSAAVAVAANIQAELAGARVENGASEIADRVTVSIGIACDIPSPGATATTLVGQADRALYRAKVKGRNRYEVADEPSDTLPDGS